MPGLKEFSDSGRGGVEAGQVTMWPVAEGRAGGAAAACGFRQAPGV